jgi:hypothetical protein
MAEANIARKGVFNAQLCTPKETTNEEALRQVEELYPCGTDGGWHMLEDGDDMLGGSPQRARCEKWRENVHIMFVA